MNISFKTEYALQAVFDLATQPPGEPVKIADIAQRQNIPQKFLELILASLKQAGFVESRRGAEGGYLLAKPMPAHQAETLVRSGSRLVPSLPRQVREPRTTKPAQPTSR